MVRFHYGFRRYNQRKLLVAVVLMGGFLAACDNSSKSDPRTLVESASRFRASPSFVIAGCEDRVSSPRALVCSLYQDFRPDGGRVIQTESKEILSKYFDETLVGLFVKHQACEYQNHSSCTTDRMLLFNAPSHEITEFRIGPFDQAKNAVEVHFKNFGESQIIICKLKQTPAGWRITSVDYDDGSSIADHLSRKRK